MATEKRPVECHSTSHWVYLQTYFFVLRFAFVEGLNHRTPSLLRISGWKSMWPAHLLIIPHHVADLQMLTAPPAKPTALYNCNCFPIWKQSWLITVAISRVHQWTQCVLAWQIFSACWKGTLLLHTKVSRTEDSCSLNSSDSAFPSIPFFFFHLVTHFF